MVLSLSRMRGVWMDDAALVVQWVITLQYMACGLAPLELTNTCRHGCRSIDFTLSPSAKNNPDQVEFSWNSVARNQPH